MCYWCNEVPEAIKGAEALWKGLGKVSTHLDDPFLTAIDWSISSEILLKNLYSSLLLHMHWLGHWFLFQNSSLISLEHYFFSYQIENNHSINYLPHNSSLISHDLSCDSLIFITLIMIFIKWFSPSHVHEGAPLFLVFFVEIIIS